MGNIEVAFEMQKSTMTTRRDVVDFAARSKWLVLQYLCFPTLACDLVKHRGAARRTSPAPTSLDYP